MRVISFQILMLESTSDDEYGPCGAENDEDSNSCCCWSTKREIPANQINTDLDLDEFGRCPVVFEDDLKPHNIVELISNDRFLDLCIEATNAHEKNDPIYLSRVRNLKKD